MVDAGPHWPRAGVEPSALRPCVLCVCALILNHVWEGHPVVFWGACGVPLSASWGPLPAGPMCAVVDFLRPVCVRGGVHTRHGRGSGVRSRPSVPGFRNKLLAVSTQNPLKSLSVTHALAAFPQLRWPHPLTSTWKFSFRISKELYF